jgi:hypothetical protein
MTRALLSLVLLLAGCAPPTKQEPVPLFSLLDVNAASPRAGQQVSPADYPGQVTGWYFGHSS